MMNLSIQISVMLKQFSFIFGAMSQNQSYQQASENNENKLQIEDEHQEEQEDNRSEFSEDFQSDPENIHDIEIQEQKKNSHVIDLEQSEKRPVVKNPVSAYMMFVKSWKQQHPNQKMSISFMGQIWNQLDESQKSIHEQKYRQQKAKYDQYVAYMLARDPNFNKKSAAGNKTFFPLHRVKSIMKQDGYYTANTENVTAMANSVEYFGEYLLEQVKKMSEGKKRIDLNDLFGCINANQSNLWFLKCLIDEHNMNNEGPKKHQEAPKRQAKPSEQKKDQPIQVSDKKNKKQMKPREKLLPKGQMKLTDMF